MTRTMLITWETKVAWCGPFVQVAQSSGVKKWCG